MAVKKSESLRFTRLELVNWRNFRNVDIKLEKRAFIVGPNASGKSNLVDSIRFLSDLARPGSGGLQAALTTRGGFSSIRCLQARTIPYVELKATIGNDTNPGVWRYRLQINSKKTDHMATVSVEEIYKNGIEVKSQVRSASSDPIEFSQTLVEQVNPAKDFRDLNNFLKSCRYTHVVPQIIRDRHRARSEGDDPFGGDLLRRIKDTPKKMRDPRLQRISSALEIAVPQFANLELRDDADGVPHLWASYVHWRAHASKQSETAFSDGTLRLIGLLWAIAEQGGPLLLEEPELSLNDGVIRQLPRMFQRMQKLSGRQVIASTHAHALLDEPNIGLKEVHMINVDGNGIHVKTIADDLSLVAEIENDITIGQAVIPRIRPQGVAQLGLFDV